MTDFYPPILKDVTCRCCGARGLTTSVQHGFSSGVEFERRVWACVLCGDGWIVVKASDEEETNITFDHNPDGLALVRRATMATNIDLGAETEKLVETWTYYLGEDEVDEATWRAALKDKRRHLKARIAN